MKAINYIVDRCGLAYEVVPSGRKIRMRSMEGMRGLAVLLVFFVHYHALIVGYTSPDTCDRVLLMLSQVGHAGVDLFFVLSGYLIYGSVIKRDTKITKFLMRRAQRIYPTFLAVFVLYLCLSYIFPSEKKITQESPIAALTYVAANLALLPGIFDIEPIITVAWSLSYEWLFYIVAPLTVSALRMRQWSPKYRVTFICIIVCTYSAYCLVGSNPRVRLLTFGSGMLLYESIESFGMLSRLRWPASVVAIIVLVVGLAVKGGIVSFEFSVFTDYRVGQVSRVLALCVALYVFVLVGMGSTFLGRVLVWAPARYLGNMSYSYYLIHGVTINGLGLALGSLLHGHKLSTASVWLLMPIFFAITWITATVLFLCVEKPMSISSVDSNSQEASQ